MERKLRCGKCGSTDIRPSEPHSVLDIIMERIFKRRPFRCRSCRHRFFAVDAPELHVASGAGPG